MLCYVTELCVKFHTSYIPFIVYHSKNEISSKKIKFLEIQKLL